MKNCAPLLVLFGLLTVAVSGQPVVTATNCSCIAFRLDDIQDYWISGVQKTVMDIFQEMGIPLTIGIIANEFGEDDVIVDAVKAGINNATWDLEVCSHGFNHEDFSTFTLAEQNNLLIQSKQKIYQMLSPDLKDGSIVSFIPPYNAFNDDTLTALKNQSFKYMSSQTEVDTKRPYPLIGQSFYRFPIGASTNDLNEEVDDIGVTHQVTWSEIQQQLATDGFSVVMMHPQDYSQVSNGENVDILNDTMITELRALLTQAKASGLRIVPIRGVNVDDYINGGATTAQAGTTGMGGAVTTGSAETTSTTGSIVTTGQVPVTTTGMPAVTTGLPSATTTGSIATTGQVPVTTTGVPATTGNGPVSTTEATTGSDTTDGNNVEDSSATGLFANYLLLVVALIPYLI